MNDWLSFAHSLQGLDLPDPFFQSAERFVSALQAANRAVNLVSQAAEAHLRSHVVDSLQVLRLAGIAPCRAIDVGSGGGFPGVPVAIARPAWEVSLLDSLQKKQAALQSMSRDLGWTNVRCLTGRAEDLARQPQLRESFDLAFCRAVGRFSTVLELTIPFLKVGGRALIHRGHEGPNELAEARSSIATLGGKEGPVFSYRIFGLDLDRFIICIEKSMQTSDAFPRRPGVPSKKPLP